MTPLTSTGPIRKLVMLAPDQYAGPHPSVQSLRKRTLDVLGSLLGLLALAVLIVPIAIAIKLDSHGPIFFVQERYGLMGKPFRIYKFRSMVVNADRIKSQIRNQAKGLIFKNHNDPRVTRVGKFLRQTSLDEMPQFFNVLRGEMSLVGTRPPVWDEVSQYNSRHWLRLRVRPGITGEWQTHGRSTVEDFEEIVNLDLRYQQQWSVGRDLWILAKTLKVMITRSGAV
jgi:lipopolysaccharide/colanic/teichoic acid biosynthesis glycosyltransferase